MLSEALVMTKQNLTIIMLLAYAPCIFVSYMVTNAFIVSGVLRHWNDVPSSTIIKPKKKGYAKHKATFLKIEDAVFWEEHVKQNLNAVDIKITVK